MHPYFGNLKKKIEAPKFKLTFQNSQFLNTFFFFYRCSIHSEIYVVHSPTYALFIKFGNV